VTVTVPEEPKNDATDEPEEPVSEYDFFIPNAFTPNGDGINDLLYFKANFEPKTFEVAIYNRRGEQVYHSRNMENGWDGTLQGRELPGEVYSYVIKYTDPDNKVLSRRGQVIIIR
jgi:gliding motility-associated-like protein